MPSFDLLTFLSQVFWLQVASFCFYIICLKSLSKLAEIKKFRLKLKKLKNQSATALPSKNYYTDEMIKASKIS